MILEANVDIWKDLAAILIVPPHTYIRQLVLWNKAKPMIFTYQEETKQPRRPIAGLPAFWVLSSAGKLIRYLYWSYFLPYHNTGCEQKKYFQWSLCHVQYRQTATGHAPYCWLATNLFWYSAPTFLKVFWENANPPLDQVKYKFSLIKIFYIIIW